MSVGLRGIATGPHSQREFGMSELITRRALVLVATKMVYSASELGDRPMDEE